jgi:hypothetical protein
MSGCHRGLRALMRQKSHFAVWTHCMIQRQALPLRFEPGIGECPTSSHKCCELYKNQTCKVKDVGKIL